MASRPELSVVPPSGKPARKAKPKTLSQAVESGTYLEILLAQRRSIVADLPNEKGPAKAALHRQLALISKEVEVLQSADPDGEGAVTANTDDEAWNGTGY